MRWYRATEICAVIRQSLHRRSLLGDGEQLILMQNHALCGNRAHCALVYHSRAWREARSIAEPNVQERVPKICGLALRQEHVATPDVKVDVRCRQRASQCVRLLASWYRP